MNDKRNDLTISDRHRLCFKYNIHFTRRADDIYTSVTHSSALIKNEVPICKGMFDKV